MNESSTLNGGILERNFGFLLRIGVFAAAFLVLCGGLLLLVRHGGDAPEYHVFRGVPGCAPNLMEILGNTSRLHDRCIMMTGLLLLIATPVLRVFVSAIIFLRIQDCLYFIITMIVLGFLLFSLFFGGI